MNKLITPLLLVIILGLTGYIASTRYTIVPTTTSTPTLVIPTDQPTATPASPTATPTEEIQSGTITGPLSYPSSFIPEDMRICATPLVPGPDICVNKDEGSFSITVPVGVYNVYAYLISNPSKKAYYNKFVTCGLNVSCTDRTKIDVVVASGATVKDVKPHDWYEEEKLQATSTPKPTIKPTATLSPTPKPAATPTSKFNINPNIFNNIILPTATLTPININVPTIKTNFPF